jgi:predicted DNA-binding transcriptional regulator AlpA
MRRYRSADETREILRSFEVLDEAAFDRASYRSTWEEDPTAPAPSVVVGSGVYGWDELELEEWMMEYGVWPETHSIVSGPTGFPKTSLIATFE